MTLNEIPINKECYINNINTNEKIQRRLLDLGLIKGTKIKPVLISPTGDPIAYEVRGSLLAIRQKDSKKIEIKKI